jgi:hypothetical protein
MDGDGGRAETWQYWAAICALHRERVSGRRPVAPGALRPLVRGSSQRIAVLKAGP